MPCSGIAALAQPAALTKKVYTLFIIDLPDQHPPFEPVTPHRAFRRLVACRSASCTPILLSTRDPATRPARPSPAAAGLRSRTGRQRRSTWAAGRQCGRRARGCRSRRPWPSTTRPTRRRPRPATRVEPSGPLGEQAAIRCCDTVLLVLVLPSAARPPEGRLIGQDGGKQLGYSPAGLRARRAASEDAAICLGI